jgi:AraC-like DNA-binding protein
VIINTDGAFWSTDWVFGRHHPDHPTFIASVDLETGESVQTITSDEVGREITQVYQGVLAEGRYFHTTGYDQGWFATEKLSVLSHSSRNGGVAAIAEMLRVAPATLSRTYTEHYGYGPREAIERCRLSKAEQLLVESDYAIDRIAHKVGYHSHTAFGRAFRRRHGITPRLWRRRQSLANEV